MRNVYLDTETTSITPGQIAELSMVVEDYATHKILGAYNYFFTVEEMNPAAEETHGFSMQMLEELSGGKTFQDCAKEIADILNGSIIIAHNVEFDLKFLSMEFWRLYIEFKPFDKLCTMNYFRDIIQIPARNTRYGKYKNPKLVEVLNFLNIDAEKVNKYTGKLFNCDTTEFHDSRFDTTAMVVAINTWREGNNREGQWHKAFGIDI